MGESLWLSLSWLKVGPCVLSHDYHKFNRSCKNFLSGPEISFLLWQDQLTVVRDLCRQPQASCSKIHMVLAIVLFSLAGH